MSEPIEIVNLLRRSDELFDEIAEFLALRPYDNSPRIMSSRALCGVSVEHAESVRVLIATGNFTSSLGVLRMQYESLVKALWALYAASDISISKLQSGLTAESVKWADNVPALNEILDGLKTKAPADAINPLIEFKEYSWKPLSSYIHGGVHAITRHEKGYPGALLSQAVKASNGLLGMSGMLLVILSGDGRLSGRMSAIQKKFADCCPEPSTGNVRPQRKG